MKSLTVELKDGTFRSVTEAGKIIFVNEVTGKTRTYLDPNRQLYKSYPEVKEFAHKKGITYELLAKELGTSQPQLSKALRGKRKMPDEWKCKISQLLGMSEERLFG